MFNCWYTSSACAKRGASATRARRHEKIENKRNRIVFRLDTTDNHDA